MIVLLQIEVCELSNCLKLLKIHLSWSSWLEITQRQHKAIQASVQPRVFPHRKHQYRNDWLHLPEQLRDLAQNHLWSIRLLVDS